MWNKFVELLQEPSFKRLSLAVVISAIVHAFFLDGFHIRLPSLDDDIKPLEARIQINQPKATPLENLTKEAIVPKQIPSKPVEPPKTEETIAPKETIEMPEQLAPETEDAADNVVLQQPSKILPPEDAEQQEATEREPVEPSAVLSENAYQYIETDFEVHTEADGSVQGFAKITHEVVEGNLYNLNFVIEPKGVVALFVSNLIQTSKGVLTSTGLQPNSYSYQYGDKTEKMRIANFDWLNKKLELITSKGSKIEELPEGTQDLLSFMYQFMYVPPLQQMQINITNGKKLTSYGYGFEGEEVLFLPGGEFRTLHIVHTGAGSDEKTDLWLAIDYQHLPVKIVKTDKESRYYEFVATRISTTRPTAQ